MAIDTLSAIETPSEFLFAREEGRPTQAFAQQRYRPSRPPPKPKIPTRSPSATFLYIRSADLEPPYDENHIRTYLLRCPTCFRTTFTSLQGLLNHARISHSQEWGSHDECVRACAVSDEGIDASAGIEVGLGPAGILPGLRSLFQRAVGAHPANGPFFGSDNVAGCQETTSGSHLARTLGLHKDTPALAPFLGKEATRRGIKEWDNDSVVDVDGFEGGDSQSSPRNTTNDRERGSVSGRESKRWRMPYMHRNDFEPTTAYSHVVIAASAVVPGDKQAISNHVYSSHGEMPPIDTRNEETTALELEADLTPAPGTNLPPLGTRFHFGARIVITDHSLWIPPGSCHHPAFTLVLSASLSLSMGGSVL